MKRLKILMAASEAGAYARTGGLGDVMGALPGALARLGHEVKVVLPRYSSIDGARHRLSLYLESLSVPDQDGISEATVERAGDARDGVEQLFIGHTEYFNRADLYVDPKTGKDYPDNDLRFAFFARAVLELARVTDYRPDIIHVHDWQTALVPAYLKSVYAEEPSLARSRSVLTIHNLGYQGIFDGERFEKLGLPAEMFYAATGALEFYKRVNFLKSGIMLADKVTTVSEQYAREIQASEEFGCGLQGVLTDRTADLKGIVNGVDYSIWSPKIDKAIAHRYHQTNMSGKRVSKVELLHKAGLPIRERAPLIGMVTRLTLQKGIDLVVENAEQLLSRNLQMIILGTGDERYHQRLKALEKEYPDKLKLFLEFNDSLAHEIQAGSDLFLMPSQYEPCGLNQLYALKYGTVPVVRAVGGLVDTVTDYNPETESGTGFVFDDYTAKAMLGAIDRALKLFGKRQKFRKLIKAGMSQDWSWDVSAGTYVSLYESLADH